MELPFDYVMFYLITILRERNMKMKINKKNLKLIFRNLIDLLPYDEDEKKECFGDFDYNYELYNFIELYCDYIDDEEDYLIFDFDIDFLNDMISSIKSDYSEYVLDDICSTIDENFVFLDLLGIKIQKNIFNKLLEIENEVEIMYDNYHQACNSDQFMKELKSLILKRKMFLSFVESRLNDDEYYDLYIYASNIAVNNDEEMPIEFEFQEDCFNADELVKEPMFKAIFYKDRLALYNIARRMDVNISNRNGMYKIDALPELKFYLTFLKFLDEEISSTSNIELLEEFRTSKYRLMNVLDTVFDTYTFIDEKDYVNVNKVNIDIDYSFVEDKIFYFIKEILKYSDDKYKNDDNELNNLINYYFNTIKKLLIKTYYYLTNDDRVIEKIKNNPLYGVNKISTMMLDTIIEMDKDKTKIKRRID